MVEESLYEIIWLMVCHLKNVDMHMIDVYIPLLLDIKEFDSVSLLEEQMTRPGIEDALTWRTLDLLGHLVTQVLDYQLHTHNQTHTVTLL